MPSQGLCSEADQRLLKHLSQMAVLLQAPVVLADHSQMRDVSRRWANHCLQQIELWINGARNGITNATCRPLRILC